LTEYITSYQCKGSSNSQQWDSLLKELGHAFVNNQGGADRNVWALTNKFMNEISRRRSVPKDEACYLLAGGVLVYNTMRLRKCAVNAVTLDELLPQGAAPLTSGGFTWKSIVLKYKARPPSLEFTNLYKFAAHHLVASTPIVPVFFGFTKHIMWPPHEEFSKWMLGIYKPWRETVNEVKGVHASFQEALISYMWHEDFPTMISVELLRRKLRWTFNASVDHGMAVDDRGHGEGLSLASDLCYSPHDMAAADFEQHDSGLHRECDADLQEADFDGLSDGGPDVDWNCQYLAHLETVADLYKKSFYLQQQHEASAGRRTDPFVLLDSDRCRPENAQGQAQKIIIALHLYVMKMWIEYWEANDQGSSMPQPPFSAFVKVQGNPGTGKSFIIRTTRNITRQLMKTMGHDKATAPTGCAASLIDGATDARAFPRPVGKTLQKAPSAYSPSSVLALNAFHKQWLQCCHLCMDEDSMDGRPTFAWKQHRAFEGRQVPIAIDTTAEEDAQEGHERFPAQVTSRSWGGIPIVYSIGDCHQLPPVGMKPIWDLSDPSSPDSADAIGRLTFHEFLSPDADSGCIGVSIIMDEVIRQSDPAYQQAIQALRDGNVDFDIATYFMNRRVSQLSPEEQSLFREKALYIMPTWKATVPITVEYLKGLNTPVARSDIIYNYRDGSRNHMLEEGSLPTHCALAVGAVVMLLTNYIVEHRLMNGSVGYVRDIVYRPGTNPRNSQPAYVIVEFPNSTLEECLVPGMPSTFLPIAPVICRCEKGCCTAQQIPLRVCKAITIYKSQGGSVGEDEVWEYVVVCLPAANAKHCPPGLQQVALSRAKSIDRMAILDDVDLTFQQFMKIGKGAPYDRRRDFEARLQNLARASQANIKARIMALHPDQSNPSFEGGYQALLAWYNNRINSA
jgi:hypothetical protein